VYVQDTNSIKMKQVHLFFGLSTMFLFVSFGTIIELWTHSPYLLRRGRGDVWARSLKLRMECLGGVWANVWPTHLWNLTHTPLSAKNRYPWV